jgi:hypothetical protein
MRTTRVLGLIVLLLGTMAGLYARDLTDGILVEVPREIVVNEKRLPPGEYEFRKDPNATQPIIRIYNRDEMMYETPVLPVSLQNINVVEKPKLVLHKIGDDYYLRQIWIQPDRLGYEVPIPKRVRALEKELERNEH